MQKRLYRSRSERMIGGVCGGLAEYFNIDPTIVRVLFVALSLLGGPGLILYIILAIVVPEAPYDMDSKLKNDWNNDKF
jgi:phage shock protein PspC (stress-responsive transcriptional regulator)